MDAPAYHQPAPVQILRDRGGQIISRLEGQRAIGRIIARDTRGLLVGSYDQKSDTTRDARGLLIGTGNLLPALLPR